MCLNTQRDNHSYPLLQKMEILPVNDLDVALQNFVNKDDKLAFYSCVQYNLQETRVCTSFFSVTIETKFYVGYSCYSVARLLYL